VINEGEGSTTTSPSVSIRRKTVIAFAPPVLDIETGQGRTRHIRAEICVVSPAIYLSLSVAALIVKPAIYVPPGFWPIATPKGSNISKRPMTAMRTAFLFIGPFQCASQSDQVSTVRNIASLIDPGYIER
jgi:hypothetical protein